MLKKIAKKMLGRSGSPLVDYEYHIDQVTPDLISGWAKNVKLPNHSPVIDVYVNNTLTWQAISNQFRQDLDEANVGVYAFNLIPDYSVLRSECREVEIRIDGHKLNKKFPFNCATNNVSARESETASSDVCKDDFICHIDTVDGTSLSGWAKLKRNDDKRVLVELRCEEEVYGSAKASIFRQDLFDAGFGDGKYSFRIEFDLTKFQSERIEVDICLNGIQFSEEKIVLQVDPKAIDHAKYMKEFAPQLSELHLAFDNEMSDLKTQIENSVTGEPELTDVLAFSLQKIAEFSVRLDAMEKAILKHLISGKT